MGAKLILVEGEPGSGKSTAWENIPHEEAVVITPNSKPLPFRGSEKKYNKENKNIVITDNILDIPTILKQINDRPEVKYVLIEDFSHYSNARTMSAQFIAKKSGGEAFAKWNVLASDIMKIIAGEQNLTFRDDLFIFINAHTKVDEQGVINLLTPGKLLDQNIMIPSYFTYVFHALCVDGDNGVDYKFLTNKDGMHEAKTPKGMFDKLLINNDAFEIVKTIKEYNK